MKYFKQSLAVALLIAGSFGSTAANAGIPVIDAANLVQSIQNIIQWGQQNLQMVTQIQNQVSQIANQIQHIKDITGSRNLGQTFNNPLLQQIVPANNQAVMTAINTQGFAGMTPAAQSIRTGSMVYNCMDKPVGLLRNSCQAVLSGPSQDQANQTAALAIAQQRVQEIQNMQQQINQTTDPKMISEVQAAIAAETAQVQNDAIRVAIAKQMSDTRKEQAEQALVEQQMVKLQANAPSVADNLVLP